MTPAQRREARLALAMLPIGATVLVVSALGLAAVMCRAAFMVATGNSDLNGWCWALFATGAGLWNMRAGIAMMSAFDWRPVPGVLALSGLVVAGWLLQS